MPARLVTAPDEEPVSLNEAKDHLRLEAVDDDLSVAGLIVAARMWAEEHCWRGFVTQTWELVLTCFPADSCLPLDQQGIELPMGNLGAVASVTYIDPDGVQRTLASTEYSVDSVSVPGRMRLAYGKSWPSTRSQWDAVRVQYTVGWAAADVPQPVKQAMLLLVGQMYEHRAPEVTGTIISSVQFAVEALLRHYRLVRF